MEGDNRSTRRRQDEGDLKDKREIMRLERRGGEKERGEKKRRI